MITLYSRPFEGAAWFSLESGYPTIEAALKAVQAVGLSGQFRAGRSTGLRPQPEDKAQLDIPSKRNRKKPTDPAHRAREYSLAPRSR